MKASDENSLIKLSIDDCNTIAYQQHEDKIPNNLKEIEFEIISPIDFTDKEEVEVCNGIAEIDERLAIINKEIEELNKESDRLTCHADGIDYTIAVASGIIASSIDIFFVSEFSFDRGKEWSNDTINNFVLALSKTKGYKGDCLCGAIKHLEQFGSPSDSVKAKFGGGKQHHLRDFAHHPTPVGLVFSMLTQFTGKAYGTNKLNEFQVVPIEKKSLIGKDFPEKITLGLVYWVLHMASDIAGSSSNPGAGTGLPGPVLSLVKELSSFPIFNNVKLIKELRSNISKLFNGKLLVKIDKNGKIMKDSDGKKIFEKIDFRAEMGVAYEIKRQSIPIVVNEVLVRGFYFLRRLVQQLKEKKFLKDIEWKKILPFKNRTIVRMTEIATGTFMMIDLVDAGTLAAIKSDNLNILIAFILRVNFIGIGHFAIAVGKDILMDFKQNKINKDKIELINEMLCLLNAKLYYKNAELSCRYSNMHKCQEKMVDAEANMWIEVEKTNVSIESLYNKVKNLDRFYSIIINKMDTSFEKIEGLLPEVEEKNPGLVDEILRRLKE